MLHLKNRFKDSIKAATTLKLLSAAPDAQQVPLHDDSADLKHPPGFRQTAALETQQEAITTTKTFLYKATKLLNS